MRYPFDLLRFRSLGDQRVSASAIQNDLHNCVVISNDFKIDVLNADQNCSDQNNDARDWMHVAKDLPYSDFKTVISVEWNLHRPGQWDLDDLMFLVCGGPVSF